MFVEEKLSDVELDVSVVEPSELVVEPGEPVEEIGEPVVEPGEPAVEPGEPVEEPGEPVVEPDESIVEPGELPEALLGVEAVIIAELELAVTLSAVCLICLGAFIFCTNAFGTFPGGVNRHTT